MQQEKHLLQINTRAFIGALLMLAALMIVAYLLTFLVPAGVYARTADGAIIAGTYTPSEGGISFWRWIISPIAVLFTAGGGTIAAIIVFLLVIGGVFHALDEAGVLRFMLESLQYRFRTRRHMLLWVMTLFFMALGALVGSFEECVPLVPIAVALSCAMGWDALTGLGMSLLAVGCGFATGVCNPFTVGVAQELAGLPVFSGIGMRLLSFAVIYPLLMIFLVRYTRKIEKDPPQNNIVEAKSDPARMRGLKWFCLFIGMGILCVLLSPFAAFLRDAVMPLFALFFLLAGTSACLAGGMAVRTYCRTFLRGMLAILPAVALILMASSVRDTLEQGHILDTLLHTIVTAASDAPQQIVIILIYALVLVMNFFISSGSAKAFLLMPLLSPLADLTGISRQLCVLAFAYGDGFSNVFYATNPVLLISLSLVGVSYGKWARWSAKIQLCILLVTCALLLLAHAIGYGT
jgi:uncharacterized ion transporter superfamily protein YfcC